MHLRNVAFVSRLTSLLDGVVRRLAEASRPALLLVPARRRLFRSRPGSASPPLARPVGRRKRCLRAPQRPRSPARGADRPFRREPLKHRARRRTPRAEHPDRRRSRPGTRVQGEAGSGSVVGRAGGHRAARSRSGSSASRAVLTATWAPTRRRTTSRKRSRRARACGACAPARNASAPRPTVAREDAHRPTSSACMPSGPSRRTKPVPARHHRAGLPKRGRRRRRGRPRARRSCRASGQGREPGRSAALCVGAGERGGRRPWAERGSGPADPGPVGHGSGARVSRTRLSGPPSCARAPRPQPAGRRARASARQETPAARGCQPSSG